MLQEERKEDGRYLGGLPKNGQNWPQRQRNKDLIIELARFLTKSQKMTLIFNDLVKNFIMFSLNLAKFLKFSTFLERRDFSRRSQKLIEKAKMTSWAGFQSKRCSAVKQNKTACTMGPITDVWLDLEKKRFFLVSYLRIMRQTRMNVLSPQLCFSDSCCC